MGAYVDVDVGVDVSVDADAWAWARTAHGLARTLIMNANGARIDVCTLIKNVNECRMCTIKQKQHASEGNPLFLTSVPYE